MTDLLESSTSEEVSQAGRSNRDESEEALYLGSGFEVNLTEARRRVRAAIEDEIAMVKEKVHDDYMYVKTAMEEEFAQVQKAVNSEIAHINEVVSTMDAAVRTELSNVDAAIRKELQMIIGQFEEAPAFLQFNEFIHGGYRIQVQHYSECVKSIFQLHNETVNIWSHLFGFAVMITMFAYACATVKFYSTSDLIMFALFFTGASAMFLMSSLYHLFSCHSHEVYDTLLMCDYLGIFSMIFGSTISAIQLSFYCATTSRTTYQVVFTILCAGGMILVRIPRFNDHKYHAFKTLFFVVTVAAAILPLTHALVVDGLAMAANWFILLALYGCGVGVYLSRFPECRYPGRFDYLFASHQLWHMFVLAAGCWHSYSLITLYQTSITGHCADAEDQFSASL